MNRVANSVNKKGFTLIELMLAMAFISFLLLAVALSIIQVATIYSKGMLLKEVNQTSRELSKSVRNSINTQGDIDLASDYVQVPGVGGRLCLGSVSYVWNYGDAIQAGHASVVRMGGATGSPVRLAKVPDPTKKYCIKNESGVLTSAFIAETTTTEELLRGGDRNLDIYSFTVRTNNLSFDPATGQQLYTILYSLGSGSIDAIKPDRTTCKGPGEPGADLQYCTIEHFSVTVRAGDRAN